VVVVVTGPMLPLAVFAVSEYEAVDVGVTSTVPECCEKLPTPVIEILFPAFGRATLHASVNRVPAAGAARKWANLGTPDVLPLARPVGELLNCPIDPIPPEQLPK
jgi:hypothetical protein